MFGGVGGFYQVIFKIITTLVIVKYNNSKDGLDDREIEKFQMGQILNTHFGPEFFLILKYCTLFGSKKLCLFVTKLHNFE